MSSHYFLLLFLVLFPSVVVSTEQKQMGHQDFEGVSTLLNNITITRAGRSFPLAFLNTWLFDIQKILTDKKKYLETLQTFLEVFKAEKDDKIGIYFKNIKTAVKNHLENKHSTTTKLMTTTPNTTPTTSDPVIMSTSTPPNISSSTEQIDPTNPVSCNITNDLVILIDGSGSVGKPNFDISLEFTARLCLAWKKQPQSQISVIVFSTTAYSLFSLRESLNIGTDEIMEVVLHANHPEDLTYTHLGLIKVSQK